MGSKNSERNEKAYNKGVTLHDANKEKETQVVLDPEKGPENKPRKSK